MSHAPDAGLLASGARLVWQRRRLLVRVYGVLLLLGLLATLPVAGAAGRILDSSLGAEGLRGEFDLVVFLDLLSRPETSPSQFMPGALGAAVLFFLALLFLTGGILLSYGREGVLGSSEFYGACGSFFWAFLRLAGLLLVALVPVALGTRALSKLAERASDAWPHAMAGFAVTAPGLLLLALLALLIRLVFDMAQVHAVAQGERRIRRSVIEGFRLVRGNFSRLYGSFVAVALVTTAAEALALWAWARFVPPAAVGLSFVLGQLLSLFWLAGRLWQRSLESVFYRQRAGPRSTSS